MKIQPEWLFAAEQAAKKAGKVLLANCHTKQKINFQSASDVKLQADLDSEIFIRDLLFEQTHLKIIGEEQGGEAQLLEKDDFFWVVDPLDGTFNYLRNQPVTCVSIGLMKGNSFIGGVIYDFVADELIKGVVGEVVYLNGQVLPPALWAPSIQEGCLMTGFPQDFNINEEKSKLFINNLKKFKKVRMIGSAAMALAYVALGRADAYYEAEIFLWDIAAAAAILLARGGEIKLKPITGHPLKYEMWSVGKSCYLESLIV